MIHPVVRQNHVLAAPANTRESQVLPCSMYSCLVTCTAFSDVRSAARMDPPSQVDVIGLSVFSSTPLDTTMAKVTYFAARASLTLHSAGAS